MGSAAVLVTKDTTVSDASGMTPVEDILRQAERRL
jgi:hypothetical protein